jgi:hypothetical protein
MREVRDDLLKLYDDTYPFYSKHCKFTWKMFAVLNVKLGTISDQMCESIQETHGIKLR